MKARLTLILLMLPALTHVMAQDTYNQIDEMGNITERSENRNFNKHNKAHLVRAAQEGIVFSFCYGMEIMQQMSYQPPPTQCLIYS